MGEVSLVDVAWEIFGRDINPVFGSYPQRHRGGVLGAHGLGRTR
jgi:hypothetical protein